MRLAHSELVNGALARPLEQELQGDGRVTPANVTRRPACSPSTS